MHIYCGIIIYYYYIIILIEIIHFAYNQHTSCGRSCQTDDMQPKQAL